jgi:hypothetical protein
LLAKAVWAGGLTSLQVGLIIQGVQGVLHACVVARVMRQKQGRQGMACVRRRATNLLSQNSLQVSLASLDIQRHNRVRTKGNARENQLQTLQLANNLLQDAGVEVLFRAPSSPCSTRRGPRDMSARAPSREKEKEALTVAAAWANLRR